MLHAIAGIPRYALTKVRVPVCLAPGAGLAPDADGLALATIIVEDGRIAGIGGEPATDAPAVDLDAGLVLPAFVDMHTHLDKGHIWPRCLNPDGTFLGALDAAALDRERHWTAEDVERRMDFALRSAFAHGTAAIRTHLDSIGKQIPISWEVFCAMRERWAGRIELQAAALFSIEQVEDPLHVAAVRRAVVDAGGILGCVTYGADTLDSGLDTLFRIAGDEGLDLDFHVDETLDPSARSLRSIADAALRHRFSGKVTAGHCCSLACQGEDEAKTTIDRVARAGIAVVSLPMCNMYLQDRAAGRTPRRRGITLLHELKAAGVEVVLASDNTRDPFHAYGDLDMLEVYRDATRIAHLDHPVGDWPCAITSTPASVMGIDAGRLRRGAPADLVLLRARSWTELLSRPQSDRAVLRAGRPIDTTLPDYRELDQAMNDASP
jgi:cytosine/creatinine deaminase